MPCLTEATLLRFVAGTLTEAELESADEELDACGVCRRTLVLLVRDTVASGAIPCAPLSLSAGDRLDRYEIVEVLGRGGGGIVYAATDSKLQRSVAIKVVHRTDRDRSGRERVIGEARAMARLSHENVVAVYEVAEDDKVGMYLVMERVRGCTLADRSTRSWRETLTLYLQAGAGLVAAHRQGLIHGDFKPQNVLLSDDGRSRVTDFGLARSHDVHLPMLCAAAKQRVATETAVAGTPAYMAPEQLEGAPAKAASDQYSFAKSLYLALYQQPPRIWPGPTPQPPRGRAPRWLWTVLRKALSQHPGDRYRGVDELLRTLERRIARRRRTIAALAIATVVPISLLAGGWVNQRLSSPSSTRDIAEATCASAMSRARTRFGTERQSRLGRALASSDILDAEEIAKLVVRNTGSYAATLADAVGRTCRARFVDGTRTNELYERQTACLDEAANELDTVMMSLTDKSAQVAGHALAASRSLAVVSRCENASVMLAVPDLPDDPQKRDQTIDARAQLINARAQRDLAQLAQSAASAKRALELARRAGHQATVAQAMYLLAEVRGRTASLEAAKDLLYKAGYAAEAARDDLTAAQVWVKLIFHVGYRMRKYDEAARLADQAKASIERLGGDALLEGKRLRNLGLLAWVQHKSDLAIEYLEHGLKLTLTAIGRDNPDAAATISDLASAYSQKGELQSAIRLSRQALAIRERTLDALHPDVASSRNNLGSQFAKAGRYAEAREQFSAALAILEKTKGPHHPHVAFALSNLGESEFVVNNFSKARAYFKRSAAIFEAAYGANHPEVGYSLLGEGRSLAALGRYDEARTRLMRAMAIAQREGNKHAVAEVRRARADFYLKRGDTRLARREMSAAVSLLIELGDEKAAVKAKQWLSKL